MLLRAERESVWLLYLSAMKARWNQLNLPFLCPFSSLTLYELGFKLDLK